MNLLYKIPTWSWVTAIIIAVVAIIIIALIIVYFEKIVKPKNGKSEEKKTKTKSQTAQTTATPSTASKPAASSTAKTTAASSKPAVATPAAKPAAAASSKKVYHVSKRKEDGMWQIKAEGADRALKLFNTQKEAIDYCKTLAANQDASIMLHKVDGSFRKL